MPATEKLAVVDVEFGLANVTSPGPVTFDHVTARELPAGRPSSPTRPSSTADGVYIAMSSPAFTMGL